MVLNRKLAKGRRNGAIGGPDKAGRVYLSSSVWKHSSFRICCFNEKVRVSIAVVLFVSAAEGLVQKRNSGKAALLAAAGDDHLCLVHTRSQEPEAIATFLWLICHCDICGLWSTNCPWVSGTDFQLMTLKWLFWHFRSFAEAPRLQGYRGRWF